MNELASLIDSLKKAGIQPQVTIVVDPNTNDIQAVKALQTSLKNAGITANVQINLTPESAVKPVVAPQATAAPAGQERRTVRVKETRLNCFVYRKFDKAGKPEMTISEPRVLLQKGTVFYVSTTQKVSPKDSGDGTIYGTGNIEYYFVVDCPPNPAAVGLYVRKMDVEDRI